MLSKNKYALRLGVILENSIDLEIILVLYGQAIEI